MIIKIGVFFLFLAMSAFFSSSETAFISVNPYTLEYLEKKGSKRARLVRRALGRLNDLLSTILIGNTLVNVAASSVATSIFVGFYADQNKAILLATVTTTIFILIFAEITPKIVAAHRPVKISSLLIYPLRLLYFVLYPVSKLFSFIPQLFLGPEERAGTIFSHRLSEEEIKIVISSGAAGLSKLKKKMLSGIMDLSLRPVKEIMIPRTQVRALPLEATLEEVLKTIQESGYSRYPVYNQTIDNVVGLFHAKDILPCLNHQQQFQLQNYIRKPLFVPELASIEQVLLQMQERAVHLAFIVDEFGSFEGIVSLEDIMEEIVGDIRDEHDQKAENWYHKISDNEYLVQGLASVKEINELLDLKIPERKDYTTLAGFFLYHYRHLPAENSSIIVDHLEFTVVKMNKRRISLVRIKKLEPSVDEGMNESSGNQ